MLVMTGVLRVIGVIVAAGVLAVIGVFGVLLVLVVLVSRVHPGVSIETSIGRTEG
jgi:hypothetical protein